MELEVGAGPHRVYWGTPEKVLKKRVLEVVLLEGKPLYKALPIQADDNISCKLKNEEILITHRHVSNDSQKDIELAKAGCSEIVAVVEALLLLQEDYDVEFLSRGQTRGYARHVEEVTKSIIGKQENPSFSRFCYGLWKSLAKIVGAEQEVSKEEQHDKYRNPSIEEAVTIGAKLFTHVGKAVAASHPCNRGLQQVAEFNKRNLRAWVDFYMKKETRHQQSHPFKFIKHDVKTAVSAIGVVEYVANNEEYKLLLPLLQVAIPHVKAAIEVKCKKLQAEKLETDTESEKVGKTVAFIQAKLKDVFAKEEQEEQESYLEFDYGGD